MRQTHIPFDSQIQTAASLDWSMATQMQHEWSFSMLSFNAIGFDLDHTLSRYRVEATSELIFNCLMKYLADVLGYSPQLKNERFEEEFSKKGLLVDKQLGNLLKIDSEHRVLKAYHGRTLIQPEQVAALYSTRLSDFHGSSLRCASLIDADANDERWYMLITYFENPLGAAFTTVVDYIDRGKFFADWLIG